MWYPNGQLSFSGSYNFNLKDGAFESYDESGNVTRKGVYKGNKLISGESVVMDLEYAKPDVPAQYAEGQDAFNDYLERKTKSTKKAEQIAAGDYRILPVDLHIGKDGQLGDVDVSFLRDTSEQHFIQTTFKDIPNFKPALMEGVPVRSILNLRLVLTNNGLQDGFQRDSSNVNVIDSTNNDVYFIVEQMPEFQGGELGLRKFVANNIKYPVYAQDHGIQGKVYVNFIIDQDGSVRNISVAVSVDPVLDAEAKRVISLMPKWKPGFQRGKPVRVSYTVPVTFELR
jgi:TonB family protein